MPVLSAEIRNFLVKFWLLLSSDVQEKTQNQLCTQTFEDRVDTLRLAAACTNTHTRFPGKNLENEEM